ncbi:DUF4062 domain-containing protein [Paracoccus sp. KR1-242]|uniref:DUF4062 domain-containing protein n=1 Tax=Paracoccus sp. KR1-242 TaxID=3410028 RepID=UPI003C013EF5
MTDTVAQKKYQIFVSSTFKDLIEERQAAIKHILDMNHIPAGMELFPATDSEQLAYIKKVIDECDYYLLILGGRYGSLDQDGVSFTEREYDYAVESGKFVIAFIHGAPDDIPGSKTDRDPELAARLVAFREKVSKGRMVRFWKEKAELELLILKSLMNAINNHPQVGWVRADTLASDDLITQNNNLLKENASLRAELLAKSSAVEARFEDIADLSDQYELTYENAYWDRHANRTAHREYQRTVTWKDIFLGIASVLEQPKTDSVILAGLQAMGEMAEISPRIFKINDLEKTRIKLQLQALGLIEARHAGAVGGGVCEFLSLTPAGRAQLMNELVVRKQE